MDVMQGGADTKEYRQFVQHEGKDISAWHDIPLQNEDGSFNFVCEIPKETSAKMEVATVRSPAVFLSFEHVQNSLVCNTTCHRSASNLSTFNRALAAAINAEPGLEVLT